MVPVKPRRDPGPAVVYPTLGPTQSLPSGTSLQVDVELPPLLSLERRSTGPSKRRTLVRRRGVRKRGDHTRRTVPGLPVLGSDWTSVTPPLFRSMKSRGSRPDLRVSTLVSSVTSGVETDTTSLIPGRVFESGTDDEGVGTGRDGTGALLFFGPSLQGYSYEEPGSGPRRDRPVT